MNQRDLVSAEIANIIDVLEQLKDTNRMIKLHKNDGDDLMLDQYLYRRGKFVKELRGLLRKFDISPTDLAA